MMAKKDLEIAKNLRLLYVWEAVHALKRASPESVLVHVANRLGVSSDDANFKRNIYRDLKALAAAGKLDAVYSTPDGVPISLDEEESFKNVRVEYSVRGGEGSIIGGGLITGLGAVFYPPPGDLVQWNALELTSGLPRGYLVLVMLAPNHKYVALSAPLADRPFGLVMARKPDKETLHKENMSSLQNQFGRRTALLYLSEKSISRGFTNERLGHCLVELTADACCIRDFNTTGGTQWATIESSTLAYLLGVARANETISHQLSPFSTNSEWHAVSAEPVSVSLPCLIRLGQYTSLLCQT